MRGRSWRVAVTDLTGGFKCYRRAVLEAIDLDAISSRGYAFQIETTYRTLRSGFRVVEVPIRFVDREHGGSKMSRSIVLEAIWKVPGLRLAALRTGSEGRAPPATLERVFDVDDETFPARCSRPTGP